MRRTARSTGSVGAASVSYHVTAFIGEMVVSMRLSDDVQESERGDRSMDEAEQPRKQPGSMTTKELMATIQEHQRQIERFLEQLSLRASLQGYTEQQHDEALTLIQKVLLFLEAVPVPPERVEKQNELIAQLREELQR